MTEQTERSIVWERNRKFFEEHAAEFQIKHPGLFIAIHEGEIIGTGAILGELASDIYDQYGNIPFYADRPGHEEKPIQLDIPFIC